MAYAKMIMIVLAGCIAGGAGIYGVDRYIDRTFAQAWGVVGSFAPLFCVWEHLFTGVGGILLGGITLGLVARPPARSLALVWICAGYSIGIIAFGIPWAAPYAYSGQSVRPTAYTPSPFAQVVSSSEDDVHKTTQLLSGLYWATPLLWSLALTGCFGVRLKRNDRLNADNVFAETDGG